MQHKCKHNGNLQTHANLYTPNANANANVIATAETACRCKCKCKHRSNVPQLFPTTVLRVIISKAEKLLQFFNHGWFRPGTYSLNLVGIRAQTTSFNNVPQVLN